MSILGLCQFLWYLTDMTFVLILEVIGTIAFAVSGALTGVRKKLDIFGVVMLGFTTALGGGIIRDVLLGVIPPMAFRNPFYALLAAAVATLMFFPVVRKYTAKAEKYLFIMDTVGLAVFTVIGVRAGIASGSIFLAVFVGMLTGVGGGVLRDLFVNEKPYIFVKHFYACASIVGALATALCWQYGETVAMALGAAIVFELRVLAARFHWSLPKIKQ